MSSPSVIKSLQSHKGVHLEPVFCVQHRHSETGCDRCFKICPTGAIRWTESGLFWNDGTCQRCMMCVAACPTGALLAKNVRIVPMLKTLATAKKPVLACTGRPATTGHARLPCLGLLTSPELLLIFAFVLGKSFSLNLVACHDCPNAEILPFLKSTAAQVAEISDHVGLAEEECKLEFREAGVSRRELFSLLRRPKAETSGSLANQMLDVPALPIGEKFLPPRRMLLMQVVKRLPSTERTELGILLFPRVEISVESCTECFDCVEICPTGALLPARGGDIAPTAHPQNCTDCGLCSAICEHGAISVNPGWLSQAAKAVLV